MMIKPVATPWIAYSRSNLQTGFRLFCLPYAGGGASIFRDWSLYLPGAVEVCPIQLPGRESRIREQPIEQTALLVEAMLSALRPYLDKPFAIWGHSMGAMLSFEMARQLRREKLMEPVRLFVSAHRAPQRPNRIPPIHQLPEEAFVRELRQLNGTPEEVLQNGELMQLLLPVLRNDFTLVETYTYADEEPLNCSISAFGGLQDQQVSFEELKAWAEQTKNTFKLRMFPGGHFFLHQHRTQLLSFLIQDLRQFLNGVL